ncbi:MAG: threonine--tRNA ligase [Alphaproteobacteria bacterium]|nr:threonine--tRNA ligase [Alphaproteobacteria bacterium]
MLKALFTPQKGPFEMPQSAVLETMLNVTLPDGNVKNVTTGSTGRDVAMAIGPRLAEVALAIKVNGVLQDLAEPLTADCKIEIITLKSQDALELIRHDCAHVLAEAVQSLFPGTQVTIGPNTDDGFFYDFARAEPFTPEDFPGIEAKMREVVAAKKPFIREVWPREEAVRFFEEKGEVFKVELINNLPEDAPISIYRQGDWLDLCRGPHMRNTGDVGNAFKLTKVAGAYWKGDSSRPMLQRISATAWRDQKELDAYLLRIEEAEKRDHRKLGKQLELFHFQEEAAGSVFWHDKGYTLWRTLENYIRAKIRASDYIEVKTPQLYEKIYWEQSGHWENYRDKMFVVSEGEDEDSKVLALKPMNCPGHVQIFKQGIKSYRDLPIRMAEFGCCHRNEPSGSLHGLMRVRQMIQDDAHIFCTEEQIISETDLFCKLVMGIYRDMGFNDVRVVVATRPEKRTGSEEIWDKAEAGLCHAVEQAGIEYSIDPGEGAFYGPKLEFHLTDALGRSWQCGTLQLDFMLPERLDAHYIAEDGSKQRPVMLHRAALGSMERFLGILIENYAGAFPVWLAPVQVVVANIISDSTEYGQRVLDALKAKGVRAEADFRNEKINYKVREHSLQKIPYIIAVGGREAEQETVSVRRFGSDKQEVMGLTEFLVRIEAEAKAP